jgi:hypothetical protein
MPNKSKKTRYAEFRVFTEWRRRGKWRIATAFVPSMAAWLLMIARRYERMIDGMERGNLTDTVPGLAESAKTLRVCIENIQRLMNTLPDNFDDADWKSAVAEICARMQIRPSSQPLEELPPGEFEHLIMEPAHGSDTGGSEHTLHLGAGESPGRGPQRQRGKPG